LDSANLALQKLKQSTADSAKITEDAFNSISNAFLELPAVISGSETIIVGETINLSQSNYAYYHDFVNPNDQDEADLFINAAKNDYTSARAEYDDTLAIYKGISRFADTVKITSLLNKTVDTTKSISQALKSEQNLLDYLIDYVSKHTTYHLPNLVGTYRSNLQTYIGEVNTHLTDLIDAQNAIKNAPLDISSQELSIKQKENALQDAKDKLADYALIAPFDGVLAKVNVIAGDSVSSGTSAATLITKKKVAEISLNEIDVAKVKPGEKVTLTFDAVPDLTIAGSVASIDTIGTVTQGVVTYNVKVLFETPDTRIKTGMSVSAAIITDVRQDVLLVPNAAVKSNNSGSYVEVLSADVPANKNVQIGLSNDTMTEITGGINEGDKVVTQTISAATAAPAATTQNSLFRLPGTGGGGARPAGR
jgi:multidrug efflux pump subunit AcrA (membrane-fusion protein)